jgi:hypothetical protein
MDAATSFLVSSFDQLSRLALAEPFICWLHFVDGAPEDFDRTAIGIVRQGAVGFYVTGAGSAEIHDRLDDVLDSIQQPEIPTIWSDVINGDVSWDFVNLRLLGPLPQLRVVGVAAPSVHEELMAMLDIIAAVHGANP